MEDGAAGMLANDGCTATSGWPIFWYARTAIKGSPTTTANTITFLLPSLGFNIGNKTNASATNDRKAANSQNVIRNLNYLNNVVK